MIIYIEGVDGTGKSTLKQKLFERLLELEKVKGISVFKDGELLIPTHPLKPGRLNNSTLIDKLIEMADDKEKVYLLDRGPLSDIIYRTFDKFEPVITLEQFWLLYIMRIRNITIVYCDSDKSEELMIERGDDNPIAYSKYKELRYLYSQIMGLFDKVKYDVETMGNDMTNIVNNILARVWRGKTSHSNFEQLKMNFMEENKNDK